MSEEQINVPYSGDFLVYLAGIETPVESVTITYGSEGIPQATINLIPDNILYRFGAEDRVPVAIFYLDQWYGPKKEYRLLFDGDVVSWAYAKSFSGRSLQLQCVSHIAILQQMFPMFIGDPSDLLQNIQGLQQSVVLIKPDDSMFPASLFIKGISASTPTFIQRPFDFMTNMLNLLKIGGNIGSYAVVPGLPSGKKSMEKLYDKEKRTDGNNNVGTEIVYTGEFSPEVRSVINSAYSGEYVNIPLLESLLKRSETGKDKDNNPVIGDGEMGAVLQFFVKYNHKVKFDKRWVASTYDTVLSSPKVTKDVTGGKVELASALNARVKEILMKTLKDNHVNDLGSAANFYDLVMAFYNTMYYDVLVLPNPPYVSVDSFSRPYASTTNFRLSNFIIKPFAHFALPPACNILFPSMVESFTFQENYLEQNTRSYVGSNTQVDFITGGGDSAQASEDVLFNQALVTGAPTSVLGAVKYGQENLTIKDKNNIIYPDEYFRGVVTTNRELPGWFMYLKDSSISSNEEVFKQKKDMADKGEEPAPNKTQDPVNYETQQQIASADELKKSIIPEYRKGFDGLVNTLAQYEYLRQKYAPRGGTASLVFNPYIVPGFPMVIIDSLNTNMHIVFYPTSITHTLSADAGFSTSVQFVHVRTLQEAYEEVFVENTKNSMPLYSLAMAPKMPISEIATSYQVVDKAGDFYYSLLYFGSDKLGLDCVFDATRFFESTTYGSKTTPGKVNTDLYESSNGVVDLKLIYKENVSDNSSYLSSYSSAMRKFSRPICTLDQYISFIKGKGEGAATTMNNSGAAAYAKIKTYYPPAIDGHVDAVLYKAKDAENNKHINENERKDWQKLLEIYRTNVKNKKVMS